MIVYIQHTAQQFSQRRRSVPFFRAAVLLPFLTVATITVAHAQATDSLKAASDSAGIDPVRYRLLAMTTGEMMPKGRTAVGVHELVALTVNTAPLEFLQVGGTLYPHGFEFDKLYWGLSLKTPIYAGDGFIRGIAAGVNFGTFWPIVSDRFEGAVPSYLLSGTFGSEDVQVHATLNGAIGTDDGNATPFRPLQLGASIRLGDRSSIMGEAWLSEDWEERLAPHVWFLGYRNFSSAFVWEVGLVLLPNSSFSPDGPENTIGLPYAGMSYCF